MSLLFKLKSYYEYILYHFVCTSAEYQQLESVSLLEKTDNTEQSRALNLVKFFLLYFVSIFPLLLQSHHVTTEGNGYYNTNSCTFHLPDFWLAVARLMGIVRSATTSIWRQRATRVLYLLSAEGTECEFWHVGCSRTSCTTAWLCLALGLHSRNCTACERKMLQSYTR